MSVLIRPEIVRVPRFRIRTLMIGVAVVALGFGGLAGLQRTDQRMRRFLALARAHRQRETVNRLTLLGMVAHGAASTDVERHRALTDYHHALGLKYDRAARRPWLPVAPDPPEPK